MGTVKVTGLDYRNIFEGVYNIKGNSNNGM